MRTILTYIRGLLLFLAMLIFFMVQHGKGQHPAESLIGQPAVLHFTDRNVPGVIVGQGEAGPDGAVPWWFEADEPADLEEGIWPHYRAASIHGGRIIGNITDPEEPGMAFIMEQFRTAGRQWFDYDARESIQHAETVEREEYFFTGFSHEGFDCHIGLRIRVIRISESDKHYVVIDQVNVAPAGLASAFGKNGAIKIEVSALFGEMEFFSQQVWWDMPDVYPPFVSPGFDLIRGFEPELWAFLYNEPMAIRLMVMDSDPRQACCAPPKMIADEIMESGMVVIPPPSPGIDVTAGTDRFTINITSDADPDSYVLFKSQHPGFLPQDTETIPLAGPSYEDTEVVPGTTFYYRAAIIKEGISSQWSHLAAGMTVVQYELVLEPLSGPVTENQPFFISGQLNDADGQPVADASISVTYNQREFAVEPLKTNPDGTFQFEGRAPTQAGNYQLTVAAGDLLAGDSETIMIEVVEREVRGRDVSIDIFGVDSERKQANQNITTSITLTNHGVLAESHIELSYTIRDQDGQVLVTHDRNAPVIQPGNFVTISQALLIPPDTPEGNYSVEVVALNETGEEELMGDNREVKSFYVVEIFSSPVYRTAEYTFNEAEPCQTIDGYWVCIKEVSDGEEQRVVVTVATEESPLLDASVEEEVAWFSNSDAFVVVPLEAFLIDKDAGGGFYVRLRAGQTNVNYQVSPALHVIRAGHAGMFQVTSPAGSEINLESFSFKHGDDGDVMNGWAVDATHGTNTHTAEIEVHVPQGTQADQFFQSYIRWDDKDYRLYKMIRVKCAPPRELALVDVVVDGPHEALHLGDVLSIDGTLVNMGAYRENQFVELSVRKHNTLIYTDYRDYTLEPAGNVSFTFVWSSMGQPTGPYDITVRALNQEDETPHTSVFEQQVPLNDPPAMIIAVADLGVVREIGDVVSITATITDGDDTVIDDAILWLEIVTPDQIKTTRAMSFHAGVETYRSEGIRLNMGGNYRFSITASHPAYSTTTFDDVLQTYVDVLVDLPYGQASVLDPVPVVLSVSNSGDIAAIAGDLLYDPQQIEKFGISAFSFMGAGSQVPVSLNAREHGGGLVVGLTRLASWSWGAVTHDKEAIMSVVLLPKREGGILLDTDLFGLMSSGGHELAHRVVMPDGTFAVNQPTVTMRVLPDKVLSLENAVDTGAVFVNNACGLLAIAGDIVFDPSKIRIIDVWEGDVLNEQRHYRTSFHKTIDNTNGRVIFALSRIGSQDRGVHTAVGRVLNLAYQPLVDGAIEIALENTGMMSVIDHFEQPHQTYMASIVAEEADPGDSHVYLDPVFTHKETDLTFQTAIYAEHVSEVAAFVADIEYNPSHIEPIAVTEGTFLNEEGEQPTSMMQINDAMAGNLHVAVARLGAAEGAGTSEPQPLLSITWKVVGVDSTDISLGSSMLLKSDGVTPIAHHTSDASIDSRVFYTLTIAVDGEGTTLPPSGTHEYLDGTVVDLTATPAFGHRFDKWVVGEETFYTRSLQHTLQADITATAHSIYMNIPENRTLSDHAIGEGLSECYDALLQLTVENFSVDHGGSVIFSAGQSIRILPETQIKSGGYLYAYIAMDDDYCWSHEAKVMPLTAAEEIITTVPDMQEQVEAALFKVYPNPTSGLFTLELNGYAQESNVMVEVYGMRGEKVLSQLVQGIHPHVFSLEGRQTGVYIVRVLTGNQAGTVFLIKR